jgi:triacylglycerol lipase
MSFAFRVTLCSLAFVWVSSLGAFAQEKLASLKNPVVFVHGATLHGSTLDLGPFHMGPYFRKIPELYKALGTDVRVVELTADSSLGERAAVLKNLLDTELKGKKVHLVTHSLGGLDGRYLISVLRSESVLSLVTIGTPHRGTPLADWAVDQVDRGGFWYRLFALFGYDLKGRRFLRELTTQSMERFNQKVLNDPKVVYLSVIGEASFAEGTMSWVLWFTNHWLNWQGETGKGDGLVPSGQQEWGEVLARTRLDHLAQMNHHYLRRLSMEQEAEDLYWKVYGRLLRVEERQ